MTTSSPHISTLASASYAVLRQGGSTPETARRLLDLPIATADRFERLFRARTGGGADPMRPAFARHAVHVRAVLAQGGFPVLRR